MKKVVLALGVIAMMGAFCSCKKTCSCTMSVAGISQTTEVNMKDYNVKKCSELTKITQNGITIDLSQMGMTCK